MGIMRVGYGSEFHLLRMLGRHREQFNQLLCVQFSKDHVQAECIEWLDFPFNPKHLTKDGEWKSVDFLQPDHGGKKWQAFWPDKHPGRLNRDGMPSWDAIGKLHGLESFEWLLVEAKAHEDEFASPGGKCGAGVHSLTKIETSLYNTYLYLGGDSNHWSYYKKYWLGRGYQMANRLAILYFLMMNEINARLIYVCFIGDTYKKCPSNLSKWNILIKSAYSDMGISLNHTMSDRVHYIFPHVSK